MINEAELSEIVCPQCYQENAKEPKELANLTAFLDKERDHVNRVLTHLDEKRKVRFPFTEEKGTEIDRVMKDCNTKYL